MVTTAVGGDQVEPPATGCWCCGDRTVVASLLRLDGTRRWVSASGALDGSTSGSGSWNG